jgi:Ser/Thr protein kinase RdoA (MazF antagonist)
MAPDILPRVSAITGRSADDRILEQLLGEPPVGSRATRWGFDAWTRLVTTASGREVVVQVRDADVGGGHAAAIRAATGALRTAGIRVPSLVGATVSSGRELLVFALVPGQPGPDLLGDRIRGPELARSMGRLAGSLAAVSTSLVTADDAWVSPGTLQRAADGWQARLGGPVQLPAPGGAAVDGVARALAHIDRLPWSAVVSHGDFVPANVLVAADGSLTLLDLGGVASRHPALDAAWWALIVRHHHAAQAPRLTRCLLADAFAAGTVPDDRLLASLALVRAIQLAADRDPGEPRRHLLDLAASAAEWARSGRRGG